LTHNLGYNSRVIKEDLPPGRKSRKSKRGKEKKGPRAPNFQERIAKAVQVLSNLNESLFDFLFVVKNSVGQE
jgi:hypothetical protein